VRLLLGDPDSPARVVDRWQELENVLAKRSVLPDLHDPKVLREYLLASTEGVIALHRNVTPFAASNPEAARGHRAHAVPRSRPRSLSIAGLTGLTPTSAGSYGVGVRTVSSRRLVSSERAKSAAAKHHPPGLLPCWHGKRPKSSARP
jgi:hypothetical protein